MTWDASSHLCPVSKPKAVSSSSSPNASRLRLRTHHLTDSLVGKLSGEYRAQGTPHSGTGVVAASRDPREGLCSAAPPGVPQHVTAWKKSVPGADTEDERKEAVERRSLRTGDPPFPVPPLGLRPRPSGRRIQSHFSLLSATPTTETIFLV